MYHVFLSHSNKDIAFVTRIFNILNIIKLNCYVYKYYPQYGDYIPEIIKQSLKSSKTFVVLLTEEGVKSQWVNQEIGMAFALDKLIIPIIEQGIETKGFVELRQRIDYNKDIPEDTIFDLVYRLRVIHPTIAIDLYCENADCENHMQKFSTTLMSQDDINSAIERDLVFGVKCPLCGYENVIHPKTLEQDYVYKQYISEGITVP